MPELEGKQHVGGKGRWGRMGHANSARGGKVLGEKEGTKGFRRSRCQSGRHRVKVRASEWQAQVKVRASSVGGEGRGGKIGGGEKCGQARGQGAGSLTPAPHCLTPSHCSNVG